MTATQARRGTKPAPAALPRAGAAAPAALPITAAALALLGDLYGPSLICAGCTRTIKRRPGKHCPYCGATDTVAITPTAGTEQPASPGEARTDAEPSAAGIRATTREWEPAAPRLRPLPAAALALLGDLYGPSVVCAVCTRAVPPGKACAACGSRDTVAVVPPAGAEPPPGNPCRSCGTLTPERTGMRCPACYTRASRVEDYLFLTARGVQPEHAAARIGVSLRTIERAINDLADHQGRGRREPVGTRNPA